MPIGFKIHKRARAVDAALVAACRGLPVANISDCMGRLTAAGPRIRPMHASGSMAGVALTVKTRPGDNLMSHAALDRARPGDVLVVDGGGDLTQALIGELMLMQAIKRGVAGVVVNGAVRDVGWIMAGHFPVFAAGVTHRGPYRDGPGEINARVAFDGMVIEPGDLIVGDDDGVLCVPFADVEAVLAATRAKLAGEDKMKADIEAGTLNRAWVNETLKKLGCEGVD